MTYKAGKASETGVRSIREAGLRTGAPVSELGAPEWQNRGCKSSSSEIQSMAADLSAELRGHLDSRFMTLPSSEFWGRHKAFCLEMTSRVGPHSLRLSVSTG